MTFYFFYNSNFVCRGFTQVLFVGFVIISPRSHSRGSPGGCLNLLKEKLEDKYKRKIHWNDFQVSIIDIFMPLNITSQLGQTSTAHAFLQIWRGLDIPKIFCHFWTFCIFCISIKSVSLIFIYHNQIITF